MTLANAAPASNKGLNSNNRPQPVFCETIEKEEKNARRSLNQLSAAFRQAISSKLLRRYSREQVANVQLRIITPLQGEREKKERRIIIEFRMLITLQFAAAAVRPRKLAACSRKPDPPGGYFIHLDHIVIDWVSYSYSCLEEKKRKEKNLNFQYSPQCSLARAFFKTEVAPK